jgi:hypothetical protein
MTATPNSIQFDKDIEDDESSGLHHFIIYATKTKLYAFDPIARNIPFLIGDDFNNIGYIIVDNNEK